MSTPVSPPSELPVFPSADSDSSAQRPRKRARFASPPPDSRNKHTGSEASPSATRSRSSTSAEIPRHLQKGKQKVQLPCAQCRQLNLPCDLQLPCRSCIRKGVGELCPSGTLTSARVVTKDYRLHARIVQMRDRIDELEHALDAAHSQRSSQKHPLLSPDARLIKSYYDASPTAMESRSYFPTPPPDPAGTPRVEGDGAAVRISREQLQALLDDLSKLAYLRPPAADEIPNIVARCREHYPTSEETPASTLQQIRSALPSQEHASFLCEQAKTLDILYNIGQYEIYYTQLMAEVYDATTSDCPYRLAALLSLLALGLELSCVDDTVSQVAIAYHDLARGAVCLPPACDNAEVHLLMSLFLGVAFLMIFYDDKEHQGQARGILNMSAYVVDKLHLDSEKWLGKFLQSAGQWRRAAYWELICLDVVLTLSLKDRNSFPLQEPDNRSAIPPHIGSATASIEWRQQFYTRCSVPALQLMHAPSGPKYISIVKLDAAIRDFPIPLALRMPSSLSSASGAQSKDLIGQRAYISIQRDFLLIQLHRTYFLKAIDGPEKFSATHTYICSVLATFQNACQIISCVESVLDQAPEACRRIACLWTQVFGAAVGLCFIVSKLPDEPLATLSARQLDKCLVLFRKAKTACRKAAEKHEVLENIVRRSMDAYSAAHTCPSADDGPSASSYLPSPVSDSAKSPLGTADPYAHVHPILLRLLQQSKARARALRSEGILSAAWSSPQPQAMASESIPILDLNQQALQPTFSHLPSLSTSPHEWAASRDSALASLANYTAQPLPELTAPASSPIQYSVETKALVDPLSFGKDSGWATAPFDVHPNSNSLSGTVGDLSLDFGGQFDLFGSGTDLGPDLSFTSLSEPPFPYQFSFP